ncbi:MAG: DUF1707 domain-containing protein, partial [Actinomycetota bacterium]|nr:DUF1707 domain-containing protein [Actinomycetota bacterium]
MAATADPDASPPDLRVSDQERDLVLADLREHCAQGRLTLAEMTERADRVLAARTRAELRAVTAALPAVPAAGAVEAGSRSR